MRRARSIVVPIVLLVIAAALAGTAFQFMIMFNGPPPGVGPVPLERVAQALRTGHLDERTAQRMTLTTVAGDAFGRPDEQPSSARDAAIADRIGVPADRVRGFYLFPARDPSEDLRGSFTVALQTGKGWVVAASQPRPVFTAWHVRRLSIMLATIALLSLFAWAVARRISRPIRNLAEAATQARIGSRSVIPLDGPREVRELAGALEAMQERILQQAEGRSAMLAAITHDLGTPLSRIAFWVEQLPDAARERANADIAEMREMLGAALRFTREDSNIVPHGRLDLGSLIESLADDQAAAGRPVETAGGPRVVMRGDSAALRRLFGNLIENAVRYGDHACLSWTLNGTVAEVLVDDEGPGFPTETEALFAPFVRGEASRNRATGGTGLGLAIVRAIASGHGGTVQLENRPAGGGRVRVALPTEFATQ
ncbi:ATP-binding protein [Sphingomonas sp. CJ20]